MWEQYQKTFIPTQMVILTVTALMVYFGGTNVRSAVIFILLMEAFALIGARWAMRLRGKTGKGKRRKDGLLED